MASYTELYRLANEDATLRARVTAAVVIAAEAIRVEAGGTANHAERLVWAKVALLNPSAEAERMLWVALAQNKDATAAAIQGATDAALQTAINNAVNFFAV